MYALRHPGTCDTAAVAFHESFWVATSAAAPVIALAAIVALPDLSSTLAKTTQDVRTARDGRRPASGENPAADPEMAQARLEWRLSMLYWAITIVNLFAQAGLLAFSLWALADKQDLMPLGLAILLAVIGILLLAGSTMFVINLRYSRDSAGKPDDDTRHQDG
jgi:uncharacterized membrane protein YbhN (UPF0104 family)